jgi:hypothetical protein
MDGRGKAPVGEVDWKVVGPRDAARRKRVRELIEQGGVRTGKDYERAAMVFQHGDTPEDILFAHVLAVTALSKGDVGGRWLAAASLDLSALAQTTPNLRDAVHQQRSKQARRLDDGTYNRQLLVPTLLEDNCVPDREHQAEMLNAIRRGEELPAPKRKPCANLPGN